MGDLSVQEVPRQIRSRCRRMAPALAVAISSLRPAQQRLANSKLFRLATVPQSGPAPARTRAVLHHKAMAGWPLTPKASPTCGFSGWRLSSERPELM